ncbi:MAG: hypothetical protein MK132_20330, partial [Lentisphaerales bacterium]|nr:hypothetical protein [Lentisphaerales bacterium]
VLALSTDHTVFMLASLFHMGLAFVWSTNKMARMLQLSVLIFSCILNQDYGVGEQLPAAIFIILTFALLIHKSFICYIIYAVYCFLFFASIPLRLPHMEITFIFGMLLSFATFLINDKEFKSLRFLIFAGMSSWALYGVMQQSLLYYQLQFSAGFAFLVILLLRRLMGNCAPAYFFVVPLLHISSTPLSHVLLYLKKLPMSAYIIAVSFIIFGIGFYLNIKKSKTLLGTAEQQVE